eukprot:4463871-Ditylum_brightwellii.AAC.1
MLPDQIGRNASQRRKKSFFSFLSQCADGILRFLFQEINTNIIAYGIFMHSALHMRAKLTPADRETEIERHSETDKYYSRPQTH